MEKTQECQFSGQQCLETSMAVHWFNVGTRYQSSLIRRECDHEKAKSLGYPLGHPWGKQIKPLRMPARFKRETRSGVKGRNRHGQSTPTSSE